MRPFKLAQNIARCLVRLAAGAAAGEVKYLVSRR